MLNPKYLFPTALDMKWGMSEYECLEILPERPSEARLGFLKIPVIIDGSLFDVTLYFQVAGNPDVTAIFDGDGNTYDWATGAMWDKDNNLVISVDRSKSERSGLFRIETILSKSRFLTNNTYEELEMIPDEMDKYLDLFGRYVEQGTTILGDPDFSGPEYIKEGANPDANWIRNPDYPAGQRELRLANWGFPEGILQIAFREGPYDGFPLEIVLACYRI